MLVFVQKKEQWLRCLGLLSLALLFGCSKAPLYTGVSESDANQIVAILTSRGIPAEKKAGPDKLFTVVIDSEDFAIATDELSWFDLPHTVNPEITSYYTAKGLVSTPEMERVRYMYIHSLDISETIKMIDGVLEARVHIVLPETDPYSEEVTPSSASVFIKHRETVDTASLVPTIKELVVNSIEGLAYDRVSVATVSSSEWNYFRPEDPNLRFKLLGMSFSPARIQGLHAFAIGLISITVIAALSSIYFIYLYLRLRKKTQSKDDSAPHEG